MLTVLEIGARGGFHPRWLALGSDVQIIGIDADPEECSRLNLVQSAVAARYVAATLGREDGAKATLYSTAEPGCSSLFEPNHAYLSQFPHGRTAYQVQATQPVTLTRLDTLCGRESIAPDVIKIDMNGTELDILHGGEETLTYASLVELDVEFNPLYIGQPLFGDCDSYLRARGFSLLGLRRTAWRRDQVGILGGTVVQADALWIREPTDTAAQTRCGLALLAYQQRDYARSLGFSVQPYAQSVPQRLIGRVLSRLQSHREWRGWLDHSRRTAEDWQDSDFF